MQKTPAESTAPAASGTLALLNYASEKNIIPWEIGARSSTGL